MNKSKRSKKDKGTKRSTKKLSKFPNSFFKKVALGTAIGAGAIAAKKFLSTKSNLFTTATGNDFINYIEGPISMTRYIIDDGKSSQKEIIMFGDIHQDLKKCSSKKNVMNIVNVIDLMIKNNPHITIDFFLEEEHQKKFVDDLRTMKTNYFLKNSIDIINMRKFFNVCHSKIMCKKYWPNLRLHNIDIRQLNLYNVQRTSFYYIFIVITTLITKYDINIYNANAQEIGNFAEDILDLDNPSRYKDVLTKLKKQLNNIGNENIKQHLKTLYTSSITKINLDIINIYNALLICVQNNNTMCPFSILSFLNLLFQKMTFIFDFYTICRMFRSFENNNGSKDPYESKYIIFFAGQNHCYNIKQMLDDLVTTKLITGKKDIIGIDTLLTTSLNLSEVIQCSDNSKFDVLNFQTASKDTIIIDYQNKFREELKTNNIKNINKIYYDFKK